MEDDKLRLEDWLAVITFIALAFAICYGFVRFIMYIASLI